MVERHGMSASAALPIGRAVMTHTKALGYNITMPDHIRRGEQDVLAELHQSMKGRPVYLSGTWIRSIHRLHWASRPRRK